MHEFLHPKAWKPAIGYSNGVAATGRMVFTGGMVGWNGDCEFETDDFVGQVRQAFIGTPEFSARVDAIVSQGCSS